MHRSRLASLWIDVPSATVTEEFAFWVDALGSATARPSTLYPDTYFMVGTFDHLHLGIHRLDEGELRWHLDLGDVTPRSGAERVGALGARVVDDTHEGWVVFHDPAGLLFCTVRHPHHLWLDVPATVLDDTLRFWSGALGTDAVPEPGDEDTYFLLGTTGAQVTFGVQRTDDDTPARWHVDIETDDTAAEVERLVGLGARPERSVETWHILRDPAGQPFCVVEVQTGGFADARSWP